VNEVVDDPAALAVRMDALAAQIGGMGSDALRMMKLVLKNGERSDLRTQLGMEAVANGLTFQSDEFKQKKADYLSALKEGRK
jgi:enoyl-CoA hydratase/carnithine racemase